MASRRPKTREGQRVLPLDEERGTLLTRAPAAPGRGLRPGAVAAGLHLRQRVRSTHATRGLVATAGEPSAWRTEGVRDDHTLHAARHSTVTFMRNAGVPDHIVAAWHGHDEVVMRQTYSHAHVDSS